MEDSQDYMNYPQTPWYEERQNWIIILSGLLLVALVVSGGVWMVKKRNQAREAAVAHEELVSRTQLALEQDLSSCVDGDTGDLCEEREVRKAAAEAKDTRLCDRLTGESHVSCVTDVAILLRDERACEGLSDATRCVDQARFAKAIQNQDYDACDRIVDAFTKQSCQARLVDLVLVDRSCESTHLSKEACVEREVTEQAIEEGRLDLCDRLPEAAMSACQDTVSSTDVDQDGLPLTDETRLGTDPLRADTDGDGLLDGSEVEQGLDPLKADMDGDGLPDGEEVLIWLSDPGNPDTDGDGFSDAEEVRNGYNPSGEGKLD